MAPLVMVMAMVMVIGCEEKNEIKMLRTQRQEEDQSREIGYTQEMQRESERDRAERTMEAKKLPLSIMVNVSPRMH